MERFNNWMAYKFDNGPINGNKITKNSVFKLVFSENINCQDMNYFEALKYNARTVAENYPGTFDVLLSGGIDSEIVVRLNHLLKIKQNVFVFKLENDYNIKDVQSAKLICKNLDIKLNIIDWNLKKWIENDAIDIYQKTFSPLLERMVRYAWFEYFDNVIVMGEGEPYWKRDLEDDYTKPSKWHLYWVEDYFMSSIYANRIGQKVIGEWYNYTPEVVKSFHKLPIVKNLLADKFKGKKSCWSLRTDIHREIFPDIVPKFKLVGYEGLSYPFSKPNFMTDFQKEIMKGTSNTGYKFTEQQIDNMNLGLTCDEMFTANYYDC